MEVFRIVFDKCTTEANAVEGFKKSSVFPWDPTIINDKKLAPLTMFENQSQLPDVNMSINKSGPKEDTGRQNLTKTVVEVHAKDPKSKELMGMAVTIHPDDLLKEVIIDGVCYDAITPLDEPKDASVPIMSVTIPVSSAKCSEIVDEVLTMPVVKKKTLGVHLSKITRCISLKEFPNLMREKEEVKYKEEEDHK